MSTLTQAATESAPATPGFDAMATLWPLLGSLVGVLILIAVLALVAKRFNLPQAMTGQMKTLAMLPLGAKEKLVVVQVGPQQYLMGVSQQGIQMLDKLEVPLDELPKKDFGQLLKGYQTRQSKGQGTPQEESLRREPRLNMEE